MVVPPLRAAKWMPMLALVLLAGLAVPRTQGAEQLTVERITLGSVTGRVGAADLETRLVAAQPAPIGNSSVCNLSWVSGLGFWSLSGERPVPIYLSVQRNTVDPQAIELSWSGSAATFLVYSSPSPVNVVDPVNLDLETTDCAAVDQDAGGHDLLFYQILPGSLAEEP